MSPKTWLPVCMLIDYKHWMGLTGPIEAEMLHFELADGEQQMSIAAAKSSTVGPKQFKQPAR